MDYFDLGPYSRTITTTSPDAQRWFDRGLNWVYGYNHMEAIACFRKALAHDAQCAMAYWGIAYAAGPNYNLPWHLAPITTISPSTGRCSWTSTRRRSRRHRS